LLRRRGRAPALFLAPTLPSSPPRGSSPLDPLAAFGLPAPFEALGFALGGAHVDLDWRHVGWIPGTRQDDHPRGCPRNCQEERDHERNAPGCSGEAAHP
jgi:hypothetical protein